MAHNQAGVTESTERRLERCGVSRFWMDNALVISNKEVEAGIAGTGSKRSTNCSVIGGTEASPMVTALNGRRSCTTRRELPSCLIMQNHLEW
jgi:hypothetical protein